MLRKANRDNRYILLAVLRAVNIFKELLEF